MKVRRIEEPDIPEVVELIHRNWDEVLSKHHSAHVVAKFRREVTPETMRRQMSWKEVYVVESDGAIVATGALANFGSPDNPKHTVSQFFIRPDHHGRGIGTLLIRHLIGNVRASGIRDLHVPSSRNAVTFYEQAGFVVDAVQPDLDEEITWMTKNIMDEPQNPRVQARRFPRA